MAIGPEKATLIAFFVESTFYGLVLCLYTISNVILFRGREQKKANTPLLVITFGIFCFATIHAVETIHRMLIIYLAPTQSEGTSYNETLSNPSNIIGNVVYIGQTLLCDGFLIYRLFIVWGRNRLITFPLFVSYLGCAATGIGGICAFAVSHGASDPSSLQHFIAVYGRWIFAFVSLSLFTNITCTCLIAGKIWWIMRRSSLLNQSGGRNLATPMVLIIESGAFYSFCIIVQTILFGSHNFAGDIIVNPMTSIIAFTFLLLIVRLGLGLSSFGDTYGSDSDALSTIPSRTQDFASSLSSFTRGSGSRGVVSQRRAAFSVNDDAGHQHCLTCKCKNAIARRPLEVHIGRRTERDANSTPEFSNADSSFGKPNLVHSGDTNKPKEDDAQI